MIYYCCKDISPLKVSVSKLLFEEEKKEGNVPDKINPHLWQIKSTKSQKNSKSVKSSKSKKKKKVNRQKNPIHLKKAV